jgi:hypothetical protein
MCSADVEDDGERFCWGEATASFVDEGVGDGGCDRALSPSAYPVASSVEQEVGWLEEGAKGETGSCAVLENICKE